MFYGVMSRGGLPNCGGPGCGTLFRITLDGTFTRLHEFRYKPNTQDFGLNSPAGNLVLGKDGNYYGIAGGGGTGHCLGPNAD